MSLYSALHPFNSRTSATHSAALWPKTHTSRQQGISDTSYMSNLPHTYYTYTENNCLGLWPWGLSSELTCINLTWFVYCIKYILWASVSPLFLTSEFTLKCNHFNLFIIILVTFFIQNLEVSGLTKMWINSMIYLFIFFFFFLRASYTQNLTLACMMNNIRNVY